MAGRSTHPKCGKSWGGYNREHCPACCETFTGRTAGDAHRTGDHQDGRRCRTPEEMVAAGLQLRASDGLWGWPQGDHPKRGGQGV